MVTQFLSDISTSSAYVSKLIRKMPNGHCIQLVVVENTEIR